MLSHFNIDKLVGAAVKAILEKSQKGRKDSQVSSFHLSCAKTLFTSTRNVQQQLEKAEEHASKALLYAPFGSDQFVEAAQLRAKCFIRLGRFEQALLDIEVASAYGGFSAERALLKAICLHSRNQFIPLKSFLRSVQDQVEGFDDGPLLEELGKTHLSFSHLFAFVNDPNLNQQTSRPTDLLSNPPVLFYIESLTSYKAIYELDSRCKIENDDYKGRHFMATEHISKGSTLLVERSYSLVLDRQSQLEYCLFCLKTCRAFLPCKQCVEVVFCSEACSQRAWDLFHRHECTLLSIFKDTFNVSLHMYRTIAAIGHRQALAVQQDFQKQLSEIQAQDSNNEIDVSKVIHEKTIDEFLNDENLRVTAHYRQDCEQRLKMYRMNQALADHNDMYEDYYDICYMGVSIDVALLFFLKEMLSENSAPDEVLWDRLALINFNQLQGLQSKMPFLSGTIGEYVQLVAIIQLNIRKLVTNVFSWNVYDDSFQVKKNVATCQCLVGSLINHSCDPNVEWDFRNGCIIYTALRDIEAGAEISNSYGPHSSTAFIDRQNLLSSNYYFNCRCELCKQEAPSFEHVLGCLQCSGPVVCVTETVITANCMDCLAEYPDVQYRMKRVNQNRAKFKSLMHFFQDKQSDSIITDQLALRLNELVETMDYQITYCYANSDLFQHNLQMFCRILAKLGKQTQACEYGQYQLAKKPHFTSSDSLTSILAKLESSIFWFQLYCNYLGQFKLVTSASSGDASLVTIARNLVAHHFGAIQKSTVRLAKLYEKKHHSDNSAERQDTAEENWEENQLDFAFSDSEIGDQVQSEEGVVSVKQLLADVVQRCSAQYCNLSTEH